MKLTQVKVGTRLEIELLDENGFRTAPVMISKFEEAQDETTAIIDVPIFQRQIYPVPVGSELDVYFADKSGISSRRFKFRAKVTDRGTIGNLQFLKLELNGKIISAQRRKYFRLEYLRQVDYRVVDPDNPKGNDEIPFKKALTNNLSGGGIGILLDEKLDIGSTVECILKTDESSQLRFIGSVKRYEEREIKGKIKYLTGIAYIRINEKDREAVIKFIFNEQRKMRRRGLI